MVLPWTRRVPSRLLCRPMIEWLDLWHVWVVWLAGWFSAGHARMWRCLDGLGGEFGELRRIFLHRVVGTPVCVVRLNANNS